MFGQRLLVYVLVLGCFFLAVCVVSVVSRFQFVLTLPPILSLGLFMSLWAKQSMNRIKLSNTGQNVANQSHLKLKYWYSNGWDFFLFACFFFLTLLLKAHHLQIQTSTLFNSDLKHDWTLKEKLTPLLSEWKSAAFACLLNIYCVPLVRHLQLDVPWIMSTHTLYQKYESTTEWAETSEWRFLPSCLTTVRSLLIISGSIGDTITAATKQSGRVILSVARKHPELAKWNIKNERG